MKECEKMICMPDAVDGRSCEDGYLAGESYRITLLERFSPNDVI
jgi:hypothetical protein